MGCQDAGRCLNCASLKCRSLEVEVIGCRNGPAGARSGRNYFSEEIGRAHV